MNYQKHAKIAGVKLVIGYSFMDDETLWKSAHAAGSGLSESPDGNKRQALKGDAILRLLIVEDMLADDYSRG
jgi:hypothetical protein